LRPAHTNPLVWAGITVATIYCVILVSAVCVFVALMCYDNRRVELALSRLSPVPRGSGHAPEAGKASRPLPPTSATPAPQLPPTTAQSAAVALPAPSHVRPFLRCRNGEDLLSPSEHDLRSCPPRSDLDRFLSDMDLELGPIGRQVRDARLMRSSIVGPSPQRPAQTAMATPDLPGATKVLPYVSHRDDEPTHVE
jgi:hypothetical protein